MTLRRFGPIAVVMLAFGTASCSESALPPAKGGTRFVITSGGCNVNGSFSIPDGSQPTTDRYLGTRVEDGDGADVDCEVAERSGGTYTLAGYAQEGQRRLNLAAQLGPSDAGGFIGTGTVYHYAAATGALQSMIDCTFTVNPDQDVAPGRIWGNFQCDQVGDPNLPAVRCAAEGNYVFENCEK